MDRGEFAVTDMDHAAYSVIAAMVFLVMSKHSMGACVPAGQALDPRRYIDSQAAIILGGLLVRGGKK